MTGRGDGDTPAAPVRARRILGMDPAQRQAHRRRLLLEAALARFGTDGYSRTTIEALCQAAGVGTNSFYEIFPNKEELFVVLYDLGSARLRSAMTTGFLAHVDEADPIRPIVSAFVHGVTDDPRVARIAFIESTGVSPTVEEHRHRAQQEFAEGLETIALRLRAAAVGAPSGTLEVTEGPDLRRTAVALVGAIVAMIVDWLQDPEPDDVERLIDEIASYCRQVMASLIERSIDRGPDGAAPAPPGPAAPA